MQRKEKGPNQGPCRNHFGIGTDLEKMYLMLHLRTALLLFEIIKKLYCYRVV